MNPIKYLLPTLFLGQEKEKFKILYSTYFLVISGFITKIIMKGLNFFYDKTIPLNYNTIIDFIFSKEGFLVLFIYGIVCIVLFKIIPLALYISHFAWRHLVKYVLIPLVALLIFILPSILFLRIIIRPVLYLINKFFNKKMFLDYTPPPSLTLTIRDLLIRGRVLQLIDGREYRGKNFKNMKKFFQEINNPDSRTVINSCIVANMFITAWFLLYWFELYNLIPNIYVGIKWLAIYFIHNSLVLIWIDDRIDYIMSIIISTTSEPPLTAPTISVQTSTQTNQHTQ